MAAIAAVQNGLNANGLTPIGDETAAGRKKYFLLDVASALVIRNLVSPLYWSMMSQPEEEVRLQRLRTVPLNMNPPGDSLCPLKEWNPATAAFMKAKEIDVSITLGAVNNLRTRHFSIAENTSRC